MKRSTDQRKKKKISQSRNSETGDRRVKKKVKTKKKKNDVTMYFELEANEPSDSSSDTSSSSIDEFKHGQKVREGVFKINDTDKAQSSRATNSSNKSGKKKVKAKKAKKKKNDVTMYFELESGAPLDWSSDTSSSGTCDSFGIFAGC